MKISRKWRLFLAYQGLILISFGYSWFADAADNIVYIILALFSLAVITLASVLYVVEKKINLNDLLLIILPNFFFSYILFMVFIKLKNNDIKYKETIESRALSITESIQQDSLLRLSFRGLSEIPDSLLPYSKSVSKLYISFNRFRDFDENIRHFENLTFVDMTDNPKLNFESFVIGLSNNKKLKILRANSSNIKEIPDEIKLLTKLRVLELFNNPIERLPKSFAELDNLEILSIGSTPLGEKYKVLLDEIDDINLVHDSLNIPKGVQVR
jgi:hypothetical protein